MSISSIFASSATDPLSSLYAPTPPVTAPTLNASDPVVSSNLSISSAATSSSISGGAKLLKELQNLQKSDPAEFKKVTTDIAAQLTAAAQTAGGSEGTALTSLANKFTQASQTGSLSSLQPSGHRHSGHHHAASAGPSSAPSSTSSATSAAIAAYQQANSQSNPLTLNASDPVTSGANTLRTQVSGIISQVLTTDLGTAATSTSAYA